MKKILLTVSAGLVCGFSFLAAEGLVSVDSIKIMQESKEGKVITSKIQKDVETFQHQVRVAQEGLGKKAKVLSQEALAKAKKDIERDLADKEEELRNSVQNHQIALREKQLKVIKEVTEKEKWTAVIDSNTPGVLALSASMDKTDLVLKAVDAQYLASSVDAKAKNVATVTTAKNDAKTESKKDVKVA